MNNSPLKYLGYAIAMQEVPDEISLIINISGCPHHCEGCHSQYLWEYRGNYISDDLETLIDKYEDYITCVCFMGGDQNPQELNKLINYIHTRKLKVCLYTGCDTIPANVYNLNYLKVGRYIKALGGLDKPTTNQRFYVVYNDKDYFDMTLKFRKE